MASNDFNKVFMMGRLTRKPEFSRTKSGTPYAVIAMACNRSYKDSGGEKKEEVSFFNISVWGRQAETSAEYLVKGQKVLVEGRLTRDVWSDEEGNKKSKVKVVAQNVQFLEKPKGMKDSAQGQNGSKEDLPF